MNGLNAAKPYLIPIIAAAVLLITAPLVMWPWFNDVQADWSKLNAQKTLRDQLMAKADQLDKLNDTQNRQDLQTKVEPAMPSDADPSGVLGTVEQLAATAGVQPKGLRYASNDASAKGAAAGAAGASGSSSVKTNISVQGDYSNIYNFILRSENVARVVDLSSLHIAYATVSGGSSNQLVASFDVLAPYLPLPTDLGPIETPLPAMDPSMTAMLDKVSKLPRANYAPTDTKDISGRPSPF